MEWNRVLAFARTLAAAAALPALAACDIVMSSHPVGIEPVTIAAEEWQGTWISDDGALTIRVPEGPPGRIQLAWIEGTDKPELKTSLVHIRAAGDWHFGSLEEREEPEQIRYLWGRLVKDENTMLFWLPRVEKFRQLVEAGVLPGKVDEDGDVLLTELAPQELAIIASEDLGVLFEWENPTILRRLED